MILAPYPRIPLACLPTPVVPARGLSELLGAEVWIKRDDLTAGDPALGRYGGNKVRKLELLLGEAVRRRARTIVTLGAVGSHHVLATGLYAAPLGMRVVAVLADQPMTPHVQRNFDAIRAAGVEVHRVSRFLQALPALVDRVARARLRDGIAPFVIGPGGSSPLGTIGYVEAGLELAGQIREERLPTPDVIFVALGSGGTTAGILVGLRLAGVRSRVQGVIVAGPGKIGGGLVRPLATGVLRLLRRADRTLARPALDGLSIDATQLGGGYGVETPACREAIALAERHEGLELEVTYTGKAMAALVEASRSVLRGGRLLYWHTLGVLPEVRTPSTSRAHR